MDGNKNKHLYSAFRKYGMENFEFDIIDICSKNETYSKEKFYIKKYNSFKNGYNETFGGEDGQVSKMNDVADEIINLLKNSNISSKDIAFKYNLSPKNICDINKGITCHREEICYPIRKKNKKVKNIKSKEIKQQSNRPSKEQLISDLKYLSFIKVGKKYNVSSTTIRKWMKIYNEPFRIIDFNKKYAPEKIKKKTKTKKNIKKRIKVISNEIIVFNSIEDCTLYIKNITNISYTSIRKSIGRVLRNERKSYLGYKFEYID